MFTADDEDSTFRLQPQTARPDAGRAMARVLAGALVGAILAGLGVVAWEGSSGGPAARQPEPGRLAFDVADAGFYGSVVFTLGLGIVVPILIPAAFSRRGYLSIVRWIAMWAFWSSVSGIGFGFVYASENLPSSHPTFWWNLGAFVGVVAGSLSFGCLLAAAVYPKTPTATP